MPRRTRKGRCLPDPDQLAAGIHALTLTLAVAVADAKYPCAGCSRRGFWNGEYCPACTGRIILSARTRPGSKAVNHR
jgi:DNA-directed RNA polymerase subunit RPC12/RpoP